jgi:hypothetical protein
MPESIYEHDVLAWSQNQAELIRRLGRGETVDGVDWTNVAEEIESVGRSELHDVEDYLTRMMVRLLKLQAWPDSTEADHWCCEFVGFQADAQRRFTPSMRHRLNVVSLYDDALAQLRAGDRQGTVPRPWPEANPFTLDRLLNDDPDDLLTHLPGANPA